MTLRVHRAILTITTAVLPVAVLAADDNVAFIDQIGADNVAQIDQVGSLNQVGLEADAALQNGYYNQLSISQTGARNQIGTEGSGLEQNGELATPSVHNLIDVEQSSDENVVGEVIQSALGAIPGAANRLIIRQGGLNDNRITRVYQIQEDAMPGQVASVTQDGEGNVLALLQQRSIAAQQFQENRIVANFTGDFNGVYGLTGPALVTGVTSSALIQDTGYDGIGANGNEMDLAIQGNFNRFGIYQGGWMNSVGLLTIAGDGNELGVRQDGYENDLTMSTIFGDGNRVGIDQIGTNRAFVTIIGQSDENDLLGIQEGTNDLSFYVEGNFNNVTVEQGYNTGLGGDNEASVSITGSSNFFNLTQFGTNTAAITVVGDSNNNSGAGLSGVAAIAGLTVGFLQQTGAGNDFSADITGSSNLVAAAQTGDGNIATLVVLGGGTNNQAAFLQGGSFNNAYVVQNGSGNIAGIIQN
ncbi:hypothetical protein ATO6_12340 [Oceanicola sp. 22II-s10i]|uniref:hypothetical protein n=1 Tax=Oceanicola sp. 22II-s10i TaxID=1317116 RepID=UPI000B52869A|nr:hypothetical protein [Oceanicola sp. 22II-s10i]OWU84475.1 hypothetical protein ATO6_12340 [Oceanicola sp. 22II-s10i]